VPAVAGCYELLQIGVTGAGAGQAIKGSVETSRYGYQVAHCETRIRNMRMIVATTRIVNAPIPANDCGFYRSRYRCFRFFEEGENGSSGLLQLVFSSAALLFYDLRQIEPTAGFGHNAKTWMPQCHWNRQLNKQTASDPLDGALNPPAAAFHAGIAAESSVAGPRVAGEAEDQLFRQLRNFRALALVVLFALLAVVWGGAAYHLRREYIGALERVELDTGNLALAYEKYVESSLRGVDQALLLTRELWRRQPATIDVAMQQLLKSRQDGGLVLQYLIADANGKVVHSTSNPRSALLSVAEQQFFWKHQADASLASAGKLRQDHLYIGLPGRRPGTPLIFLSRAVRDSGGRFLGVVAAVADPLHFSRSTELLDIGPRGVATLALNDGQIIARSVGPNAPMIDGSLPSDWLHGDLGAAPKRAGTVRGTSPVDGEPRIMSFRHHPEFPIWIGVGESEYDVLVPYYQLGAYYGVLATLVSIALASLVILLIRARSQLVDAKRDALEEFQRYRGLVDSLPEGVVVFAKSGAVTGFNHAATRLLLRRREDMLRLRLADLQLNATSPAGRQAIRWPAANGEWVDIEVTVAHVFIGEREAIQCLLRDVSQQQRVESELRASRGLYQALVSALHEGVVLHLDNGMIAACNPAAERILGLTAAELVGRHSVDLRWPAIREDGSMFPGAQHPAIVALASGMPQRDVLMGLRKPDGEVTWISINAEPLSDESEAIPYGVVVSFTDVTARLASDRARDEAAKVFAAISDGVVVTDLNARVRTVNPAFSKITGYSRDEVVGKRMSLLRSGVHDESFYAAMWQNLRQRGEWEGEVCNRRKNGELFTEYLTISVVRDASGRPLEYVGLFRDMSARQQRLRVAEKSVVVG
jgi:PAS domain S-box-containing protein